MKRKSYFCYNFVFLIYVVFLLIFLITCEVPKSSESSETRSLASTTTTSTTTKESLDPVTQKYLGEIPPATVKLNSDSYFKSKYSLSLMDSTSLTPSSISATLEPEESITQVSTLSLPSEVKPPKGDIMFALDLTGSMGGELSNVKVNSLNIMTELSTIITDTNFGVISHMDYNGTFSGGGYTGIYGSGSDYPYLLNQPLTPDRTTVGNIINTLSLGDGWDLPESYSRVLYESIHDSTIGWREGSKKILLCWLDDQPHDLTLSTGPDPGRDYIAGTADDIILSTTLQEMKDNNITLIVLYSGYSSSQFNNWKTWAESTGGNAFQINSNGTIPDGTNIATFITSIMSETVKKIDELTLQVTTPGYEGWLVSKTPEYYNDILLDTNKTFTFDLVIKVPGTATDGLHTFTITAIGDGVHYASQQVNITVISNKPPIANAGPDQTLEQSYYQGAKVTLNGSGSSDPDGDILTYTWVWAGGTASGINPVISLPLGKTVVTLTVNDPDGSKSLDTVEITIKDTTAPSLEIPADITIEQSDLAGTYVKLNAAAKDICDSNIEITSSNPGNIFPLGKTTVILTAIDDSGNSTSGSTSVTVTDTTPPELTADFIKVEIESADKNDKCSNCSTGKYNQYDSKNNSFKCNKCGHHGNHNGHHKVKYIYKIDFTTSDICDASPIVTAFLRIEYKSHNKCVPISKEKIIEIEIDLDKFTDDDTSRWENKILRILGSKYVELVVQSVDASGNMTEVTVEPPDFDRRHKDGKRHHVTHKR